MHACMHMYCTPHACTSSICWRWRQKSRRESRSQSISYTKQVKAKSRETRQVSRISSFIHSSQAPTSTLANECLEMSDLDARLAAMNRWGNEGVCGLVLEAGVRTLRGNSTDTYHESVSGYFHINPDSTATNALVATTSGAIWSRSRKVHRDTER